MLSASLAAALVAGCQMDPPTAAIDAGLKLDAAAHSSTGESAAVHAQLAELHRLTAPYHNVHKAEAAGYHIETTCVSNPTLGAMGYHAVNTALRNDAEIALLKPDVLLYERQPNGHYRLNGVEYFVLKSTWDAAHGGATAAPPILFGAHVPLSNHPPFGEHYELHVWIFKHNPSGKFFSWNPTVSCP
jgi:hypothetical protein